MNDIEIIDEKPKERSYTVSEITSRLNGHISVHIINEIRRILEDKQVERTEHEKE